MEQFSNGSIGPYGTPHLLLANVRGDVDLAHPASLRAVIPYEPSPTTYGPGCQPLPTTQSSGPSRFEPGR
jgi:hypothetical protein